MTFLPLLPSTSVLRSLPHALNDGQRTQFESLALSSDIISIAYARLEITASQFPDFSEAPAFYHVQMFMDSWTIVHEVFLIRQMLLRVLKAGGGGGPLQRSFLDVARAAYDLRRHRDHLSENVPNLSDRKGLRPAMYGTLSWFTPAPGQSGAMPNGRFTVIAAGNLLPYDVKHNFYIAGTYKCERPVDAFVLDGFGVSFHISRTLECLRTVIEGLSEGAREDVENMRKHLAPWASEPVPLYGRILIFDATAERELDETYRYELKIVYPESARFTPP